MCVTYPGRVVAVDAGSAVVETAGRLRRASTLPLPEAAVGDWVIVGAGSILRRLDAADAARLTETLDTARAVAIRSGTFTPTPARGARP